MARYEVITGVERQRHWSDDIKLSILREAFHPGAVVAAVARRHDVRVQQIYYWRKKFAVAKPDPTFLPVTVFDESLPESSPLRPLSVAQSSASVVVEVSLLHGRGLKIPADLDRGILTSLIKCVEAA